MSAATCGDCGSPMRQTYAHLTSVGACKAVAMGLVCTNQECLDRQRAQDRADQEARDEAAITRAVELGIIDP